MVDQHQQHCFDKLRLDGGTANNQQRFVREHRGALGNSPNIAGKFKIKQVLQEPFIEEFFAAQVGDILLGKLQILNVINHLLNTGKDGYAAFVRNGTEEQIKINGTFAIVGAEKTVCHSQFVKIRQQRQIFFSQFISKSHRQHILSEKLSLLYTYFSKNATKT